MKNVLVYVSGVFTFSFCNCFYEGFIYKIILSRFLPFICISYQLKVFKFDTGIFRVSCVVPLLITLSRLLQSIAFLCLILFLMFACKNFPFRAFVTIIYWKSIEVFLNLLLHWIQMCLLLTLSKLIPLVLYLIPSVSADVSVNCISCIQFRCSFF